MVEIVSEVPVATGVLTQGLRDRSLDKLPQPDSSERKRETPASEPSASGTRGEALSEKELKDVAARAQALLNDADSRIKLTVDRELNRVVINVIDEESGSVIRQIPPEEVLKLQRFFHDRSGLLVKEEA